MINFSFNIKWPWFKRKDTISKDYYYKFWRITKHKTLEIQLSRGGETIVGMDFNWSTHCDHAGVMFTVDLFRRFLIISFCDNRHWNYDKDRYINYDDPDEVAEFC